MTIKIKMIVLEKMRFNYRVLLPALLLAILLLGVAGWFLLVQYEKVRTVSYVIPPGTGQRLAEGRETLTFPNEMNFTIGVRDILVIENQDDIVHNFGPFIILPHTTMTKRFNRVKVYQGACTFHQDQQLKLAVHPAPWNIFQ